MMKNIRLWLQKYRRREFLPGYIFDIPVYIYGIYLVLKARHIGFFSNINPGMMLSGFAGYSKYEDVHNFESKLLPKTILIKQGNNSDYCEQEMKKNNIYYPCIVKPNL